MEAIHSILNVPTVISYPSLRCLQWSPDGQACFVTKSAAYIFTPDSGISFDNYSALRSANEKDGREGALPIRWFRTMIPFDKADAFKWPEYSQAWGAASLGSIDVALLDVVFSPSGLSSESGCILAALSSNMDLSLWKATKNFLKGEWIKICDVTPYLLETVAGDIESVHDTSSVLQSQTTSIAWSQQPDFGYVPSLFVNASILAVGNRAGSITFLRYHQDRGVNRVETISLSESWITRLAFTPWKLDHLGQCSSLLAFSTADGAVGLVKVVQLLENGGNGLVSNEGVNMSLDFVDEHVSAPDRSGVTALAWVELSNDKQALVWCKPGRLHIWCGPSAGLPWSGQRTFTLPFIKLSVGSSPFHPVTGIEYVQDIDALVVVLYDGSFRLLHKLTQEPTFQTPDVQTSEYVSKVARGVFVSSEPDASFNDMNRITGSTSYDNSSTFFWVQESSRPADFSYKHDAKQNSSLIVATLWDGDTDSLLSRLESTLDQTKTAQHNSSYAVLRPFFLRLQDKKLHGEVHSRLVQILKLPVPDHSLHLQVPKISNNTPGYHGHFQESLKRHLFGWDSLLSLRLRFALTEFLVANTDEGSSAHTDYTVVSQDLLTTISHRVLRTIVRHLGAAMDTLTDQDVPFLLRMVVQALLPGSPPDLSAEGSELRKLAEPLLPRDTEVGSASNPFHERCPACKVEVPLNSISVAVCSNGHNWVRCSITTFILSTASVRTCVGCRRKAFLPPSTVGASSASSLPPMARGWVVQALLQAVNRCLYCNNQFVSVL